MLDILRTYGFTQLHTMKNETKINFLCAAVLLGICIAFAMIGFNKEEKRMLLQEQAWKQQGYPIGE